MSAEQIYRWEGPGIFEGRLPDGKIRVIAPGDSLAEVINQMDPARVELFLSQGVVKKIELRELPSGEIVPVDLATNRHAGHPEVIISAKGKAEAERIRNAKEVEMSVFGKLSPVDPSQQQGER